MTTLSESRDQTFRRILAEYNIRPDSWAGKKVLDHILTHIQPKNPPPMAFSRSLRLWLDQWSDKLNEKGRQMEEPSSEAETEEAGPSACVLPVVPDTAELLAAETMAAERLKAPTVWSPLRNMLVRPYFCVAESPPKGYIERYIDGNKFAIHPSPKCGMPTVKDSRICHFAMTKAQKAHRESGKWPRKVEFTAREYLKAIGLADNGQNRTYLLNGLERLSTVTYESVDVTAQKKKGRYFHLCSAEWEDENHQPLEKITLWFSAELYEYMSQAHSIFWLESQLCLEAFKTRSQLKALLLLSCTARLNGKRHSRIELNRLMEESGYDGSEKEFVRVLTDSKLPFGVELAKGSKGQRIVYLFSSKDDSIEKLQEESVPQS